MTAGASEPVRQVRQLPDQSIFEKSMHFHQHRIGTKGPMNVHIPYFISEIFDFPYFILETLKVPYFISVGFIFSIFNIRNFAFPYLYTIAIVL